MILSILKQIYVKMKTVTSKTDLSEVLDKKSYLNGSNLIAPNVSTTASGLVANVSMSNMISILCLGF